MKILEISRECSYLYVRVGELFLDIEQGVITVGKIRGAMWTISRYGIERIL